MATHHQNKCIPQPCEINAKKKSWMSQQNFIRYGTHILSIKINCFLPRKHIELLELYISNRLFRVNQENKNFQLKKVRTGDPQDSLLSPLVSPTQMIYRKLNFTLQVIAILATAKKKEIAVADSL